MVNAFWFWALFLCNIMGFFWWGHWGQLFKPSKFSHSLPVNPEQSWLNSHLASVSHTAWFLTSCILLGHVPIPGSLFLPCPLDSLHCTYSTTSDSDSCLFLTMLLPYPLDTTAGFWIALLAADHSPVLWPCSCTVATFQLLAALLGSMLLIPAPWCCTCYLLIPNLAYSCTLLLIFPVFSPGLFLNPGPGLSWFRVWSVPSCCSLYLLFFSKTYSWLNLLVLPGSIQGLLLVTVPSISYICLKYSSDCSSWCLLVSSEDLSAPGVSLFCPKLAPGHCSSWLFILTCFWSHASHLAKMF